MNARYIFTEFRMYIVWLRYIKYVHKCTAVFIFRSIKMYLVVSRSLKPLDLFSNKWSVFQLFSTGARGTELPPPPFSNFPVTCLFKKKSLLFHLFFLYLTCSCPYSYNLMQTVSILYVLYSWRLIDYYLTSSEQYFSYIQDKNKFNSPGLKLVHVTYCPI